MFTVTTSPVNDMHPFSGLTLTYTPVGSGLTIASGNIRMYSANKQAPTTYTITASGWQQSQTFEINAIFTGCVLNIKPYLIQIEYGQPQAEGQVNKQNPYYASS